ncbi:MAG: hypothetical protein PUE09_04220, partial [Prevotella copri]|nr:hypothetical protein [Segatella copri]
MKPILLEPGLSTGPLYQVLPEDFNDLPLLLRWAAEGKLYASERPAERTGRTIPEEIGETMGESSAGASGNAKEPAGESSTGASGNGKEAAGESSTGISESGKVTKHQRIAAILEYVSRSFAFARPEWTDVLPRFWRGVASREAWQDELFLQCG